MWAGRTLNDANLDGEIFHSIAGPYKSCLCCAEAFWKSKSAAGKIDSPTFSEREMLGVASRRAEAKQEAEQKSKTQLPPSFGVGLGTWCSSGSVFVQHGGDGGYSDDSFDSMVGWPHGRSIIEASR